MITTCNSMVIGAVGRSGIWSADTALLGNGGVKREIYTIDMTALDLDPRITYTGPAHLYFDFEGQLSVAAVNEWPISGGNLNIYGRHEPEPAAVNYQRGEITAPDYVESAGTVSSGIDGPNGLGVMRLFAPDRVGAALYDNAAAEWLVDAFIPDGVLTRVTMTGKTQAETTVRTYVARRDSANYCYGLSQQIPAGDVTASFYRWVRPGGVAVGLVQVESGRLATSPIIAAHGETGSRTASAATVDVAGYKTIRILFRGGESETYQLTGDVFSIPAAKRHWGSRYISSIELEK